MFSIHLRDMEKKKKKKEAALHHPPVLFLVAGRLPIYFICTAKGKKETGSKLIPFQQICSL